MDGDQGISQSREPMPFNSFAEKEYTVEYDKETQTRLWERGWLMKHL